MPFFISIVNPSKWNKGDIDQTVDVSDILWPCTQYKAKPPEAKDTHKMSNLSDKTFMFFSLLSDLNSLF